MDIEQKKAALLKAMLDKSNLSVADDQAIVALNRDTDRPFPLTYAQEQLWIIDQMLPESPVYTIPVALTLRGSIDRTLLQSCFRELIARHESLRTSFAVSDIGPVALLKSRTPFEIDTSDVSGLDDEQIYREIALRIQQPFNLETDPLIRACLFDRGNDEYVLLIAIHHIISDGWSVSVLCRELGELYNSGLRGEKPDWESHPLTIQLIDYAAWQRKYQETDFAGKSLDYWVEVLSGPLPVSQLPTDRPRPSKLTTNGDYLKSSISLELSQKIRQVAADNKVTPFVLLYSAYTVLLHKYTGEHDILVGTPVNSRNATELENLIGFFINTLALRSEVSGEMRFSDYLTSTKQNVLAAFDHQETPLPALIEKMKLDRDLSYNPVFQVMFALQNAPKSDLEIDGVTVEPLPHERIHTKSAKVDFSLIIEDSDGRYDVFAEYNTDLFDPATAKQFLRHFVVLLENIVENSNARIEDIGCIDDAEIQLLLHGLNETETELPPDLCVQNLFRQQVDRDANAVAVVSGDRRISYAELNTRARELACRLVAKGVGPNDIVAVCMQRSPELIVAQLAILLSGGAYLPIDPKTPDRRLAYMLEDSGSVLLLSDSTTGNIHSSISIACINLDGDWKDEPIPDVTLPDSYDQKSAAYLIYTSGSTGNPKGVVIEHRSLLNLVNWHQRSYNVTAADRATSLAGLGFDAAVWEIWPYLTCGASIFLSDDEIRLSPQEILNWYLCNEITISFLPTPLAEAVLQEAIPDDLPLRYLLTGGDKLRTRPSAALPFKLINHYGPTENTVVTTCCEVAPARRGDSVPPIGQPIDNTRVYILDDNLRPVPKGARGQLFISGIGITPGYLNQVDLNQQKLIDNPFGIDEYEKMYATGDMVRYNKNNLVDFLERTDFQVKIRGLRIELGEIESVLMSHESVKQAVVATVPKSETSDDNILIGFFEPISGSALPIEAIRQHLSDYLPDYMLPSQLVEVESFTLNASGKIDRAALPYPENVGAISSSNRRVAETEIQRDLVTLWSTFLELDKSQIGIEDDFFHLGGHSLLATKIVADINRTYEVELPVATLFEHSTIESLAIFLDEQIADGPDSLPRISSHQSDAAVPATNTQQRLWYLEQLDPGDPVYNVPVCVQLDGQLSIDLLNSALQQVYERHSALRTTFVVEDVEPVQIIHDPVAITLQVIDMTSSSEQAIQSSLVDFCWTGFDIETGPLIRFALLHVAENRHILVFVVHHIVFDGLSSQIFLDEVCNTYDGMYQDSSFFLGKPDLQFSDFAIWQQNWIEGGGIEDQLAVWLDRFKGELPTLDLPTQFPRASARCTKGAQLNRALDSSLIDRVEAKAQKSGVTLYIYLLSIYFALLHRYTQQKTLVVGTTIANRRQQEAESIIGCFVNTLALKVDIDVDCSFDDLFNNVKAVCLEAFDNQDIPFARLVEELRPARDTSRTPIYQTLFSQYENSGTRELAGGLRATIQPDNSQVAKTDLSVGIESTDGTHSIQLQYSTGLFTQEFASELLANFCTLVEASLDDSGQRIATANLVNPRARQLMLRDWNASDLQYDTSISLIDMFKDVAGKNPDKVAIIANGQSHTYREILEKVKRVSGHLNATGAQPGDMIAICLDRSELMVVAALAIFDLQATYLPIDPEYPSERVRYIMEDAKATHVLTEESNSELFAETSAKLIDIRDALKNPTPNDQAEKEAAGTAPAESVAYVIYTSGSTGKPKGVMVSQGNLTNFVNAMVARPGMSIADRVLAITTLSFDIAVMELFVPMATGATAVIANRDEVLNPKALADLLDEFDITYAQGTPSAWQAILATGWKGKDDLRLVVAGEALSAELSRQLWERTGEFWNLYGPTETTIYSTHHHILKRDDDPFIGSPVANTRLLILDSQMQPTPIGVPGELYIGGDGVSLGYLEKEELTKERFIANPITGDSSDVFYRTGDQVRYRDNGNVEYLGRLDNQVKIRGFRIELGEIESVVNAYDGVEQSVVTVREDRPGDVRLIVYYIPGDGPAPGATELRKHIRNQLPNYMVPQHYVSLDQFPMTPNAKIDRQRLPAPTSVSTEQDNITPPRTVYEQQLADIWREVLSVDQIGVHENFFDLGGHSLLSFKVIAKVRDQIGVELRVRSMIMDNLAQIAAEIEKQVGPGEMPGRDQPAKHEDAKPSPAKSRLQSVIDLLNR